ncbi:twin transmembrane helix small protein [Sedimentitalea sp. JM2-8]|uniref:Twin transmembrane helix small protein n=2 Tax=Sedimentitalea xiamensis TaxID=3050037 RepID=A0ABT7FAH7_9RHOB|nr:twin transmembrane helix small protein [Sedimentitalea xiamensis]
MHNNGGDGMGDPFFLIIILAVAAVLVVLMIGIGGFAKGGAFNQKYGNKMMQLRIAAQFVAVVLILLYIWLR